jgi:hypothetical protein
VYINILRGIKGKEFSTENLTGLNNLPKSCLFILQLKIKIKKRIKTDSGTFITVEKECFIS